MGSLSDGTDSYVREFEMPVGFAFQPKLQEQIVSSVTEAVLAVHVCSAVLTTHKVPNWTRIGNDSGGENSSVFFLAAHAPVVHSDCAVTERR